MKAPPMSVSMPMPMPMLTLAQLNAATPGEFTTLLDGTYEHSPWIAERAAASRPFSSLVHLKCTGAGIVALLSHITKVTGWSRHCDEAEMR